MNLEITLSSDLEETIVESAEAAGLPNAVVLLAFATVGHVNFVVRDLSSEDRATAFKQVRDALHQLEVRNLEGAGTLENFTLEVKVSQGATV